MRWNIKQEKVLEEIYNEYFERKRKREEEANTESNGIPSAVEDGTIAVTEEPAKREKKRVKRVKCSSKGCEVLGPVDCRNR